MNGRDNRNQTNSDSRFTADRRRNQTQNTPADANSGANPNHNPENNAKPRFKIKDGNIIRINPDGTTTSRPLTDDERRRLEEARMNAVNQRREESGMDEAARRQADQRYLAKNQTEAASQLGVTKQSNEQRRRQSEMIQRERNERQRRRRKVRINPGAVVFVLLMAAVIGISARQIKLNEEANVNTPPKTDLVYSGNETDTAETNTSDETEPAEEENLTLFDSVSTSNTEVHDGNLILVNYENAYITPASLDLKNAYEDRTGVAETGRLKVSKTTISMQAEAFDALERLVVDLMKDTGCSDLMISSGYRTFEEQQDIYAGYVESNGAEYAKAYVADPGYSEHHTGLACDLTFYTSEGYSVPISEHEFGYWLGENCMKEGFIRRYPENKADITKISYEAWHFRYVGIPNAYAITTLGLCLEEYIDYIRDFTSDTKMLHVTDDMKVESVEVSSIAETGVDGGWLVYFVPASEGDTTDIPVLRGDRYEEYEISGNNSDGFIVTVTLG